METNTTVKLTPMETTVLSAIAQGLSSKEAANALLISKRTVDFHLLNIYDKLQVGNRTGAIARCYALGLLTPPEVA